jgi:hypothetical protein
MLQQITRRWEPYHGECRRAALATRWCRERAQPLGNAARSIGSTDHPLRKSARLRTLGAFAACLTQGRRPVASAARGHPSSCAQAFDPGGVVVTNRHIQATRFSAYSGQYAAVTSIS